MQPWTPQHNLQLEYLVSRQLDLFEAKPIKLQPNETKPQLIARNIFNEFTNFCQNNQLKPFSEMILRVKIAHVLHALNDFNDYRPGKEDKPRI